MCIYVLILIISILYHMYKVTYFIKIKSLHFGVILFRGGGETLSFVRRPHTSCGQRPKAIVEATPPAANRKRGGTDGWLWSEASGCTTLASSPSTGSSGNKWPRRYTLFSSLSVTGQSFQEKEFEGNQYVSMWIRRNMLRAPNINVICHKSRKPCPFGEG